MKDANIYAAADKAIKEANREIVREFGKLKTASFDELHIIQSVRKLYRDQRRKLRQRYYEVAFESYLLGLYLCGIEGMRAHQMATEAITPEWVDERMKETNLTTRYRFDTETERKAQRLIEGLAGAHEADQRTSEARPKGKKPQPSGTDAEIDAAMKLWSKQMAQYAICMTDDALMDAYEDAGEENVIWVSERDSRVCGECDELDGQIFPLSKVPPKPHRLCRCKRLPATGRAEANDGDSKPGKR